MFCYYLTENQIEAIFKNVYLFCHLLTNGTVLHVSLTMCLPAQGPMEGEQHLHAKPPSRSYAERRTSAAALMSSDDARETQQKDQAPKTET